MRKSPPLWIWLLAIPLSAFGQAFTFKSDTLARQGVPGNLIILNADIQNISQQALHLRVVRVKNELPPGWSTSLCSGELCFPPDVDQYSIPDAAFGIPPLEAGQTAKFHLNFNTDAVTPGSASVPIRVENIDNPNEFAELVFTASTRTTGVRENHSPRTGMFRLLANYPNPFNPSTKIRFEIGGVKPVAATLRVYDLLGQKLAVLLAASLSPGNYETEWDGRDQFGQAAPSGFYFYELQAGPFRERRQMILVR
jgi:hypothetical protein